MELRLKITIRSHVNKTYWNLGKKERNGRQNAPKNTLPAKDGVPSLLNIYIFIYHLAIWGLFLRFLLPISGHID